jgi:NAD(P)H-dependent FMN reductase
MSSTITPRSPPFRIGLISGSARVVRTGPQIARFVQHIIENSMSSHQTDASGAAPIATLDFIDIGSLGLPLFNEPAIPQAVTSSDDYQHEHTRAWSKRIAALDALVFVSPQYNWGVPAGLKNAIDYLFNEWAHKPAMIVTYGGRGGDKCARALEVVLGGGVDMRLVSRTVQMAFPRELLKDAFQGNDIGLDASKPDGLWADKKGEIVERWDELLELLKTGKEGKQIPRVRSFEFE